MTARRQQPILYIAVEEILCAARPGKISLGIKLAGSRILFVRLGLELPKELLWAL